MRVTAEHCASGKGEAARSNAPLAATEPTEAGEQRVIPGVVPIGLSDRLAMLAAAPLQPKKPQRSADFGLFDLNARNQLDLFGKPPTTSN